MAGGQVALANRIAAVRHASKVKQSHVWKWLNSPSEDMTPPPEWVIPICEALDWAISPHELRPDIYPNPTDGLPSSHQEAA